MPPAITLDTLNSLFAIYIFRQVAVLSLLFCHRVTRHSHLSTYIFLKLSFALSYIDNAQLFFFSNRILLSVVVIVVGFLQYY